MEEGLLIELEGVQAAWAEAAAAATARQRVSEACAAARVWWIAAAPAGGDAEAMRRLALLRMLAPVRERHAACVICRSTRRCGYHRRRGAARDESTRVASCSLAVRLAAEGRAWWMVSHMASHMEVAGVPPAVLQELWEVFDGKERGARRRAAFEAAREGAAWWADRAGSGRSVAELMQARERASRASVHGQQRLLEPRLAVLIELEGVQAAWAEAAAAATARQRVSEACAAARVWWIAAAPAGGDAEAMRRLALLRMLAPVRERHAACVICRSTRRRGYHRRRGVATHESASYSPLFGLRYHLRIWHRFSRQCLVLERSSRRLLLHSR